MEINKKHFAVSEKEDGFFLTTLFCSLIIILSVVNIANIQFKRHIKGKVLQASTTQTKEVRFFYDAGGQRIGKIDPMGENTYYVSPDLEVVVSKDGKVSWRKNYYFGGKAAAVRTSEVLPSAIPTPTP